MDEDTEVSAVPELVLDVIAIRALPGHDSVATTEDLLTENDQLLRLIDGDIDTVNITLHTHPCTGQEEVRLAFMTSEGAASVRAALTPYLQKFAEVTQPAPHPRLPLAPTFVCVSSNLTAECAHLAQVTRGLQASDSPHPLPQGDTNPSIHDVLKEAPELPPSGRGSHPDHRDLRFRRRNVGHRCRTSGGDACDVRAQRRTQAQTPRIQPRGRRQRESVVYW